MKTMERRPGSAAGGRRRCALAVRDIPAGAFTWSAALLVTALVVGSGLFTGGPWRIRQVAGGVGGPGQARKINLGNPCAVSFAPASSTWVAAASVRSA